MGIAYKFYGLWVLHINILIFILSSPEKERGKTKDKEEEPFVYDRKGTFGHGRGVNLGGAILSGVPR
ncbi:hypothetical protein JHK87_000259 [Glycine soja]|nr:hypothetical protein JHK87_000259 [Glycine soja]